MAALNWQVATVTALRDETARVKTVTMLVPGWTNHRPGQHVDIRLTAEDGYQAQRSYSIASAPTDQSLVDLTVERVENGEVSPFLHDEVIVGDRFEVRGPIGGYFVWRASDTRPLLLLGGGSGVVPLMAMLRHRAAAPSQGPARLLFSSRTLADIIYREELGRLAAAGDGLEVFHTLTRDKPPGWDGFTRRLDAAMLQEVAWPRSATPAVFVCGPTSFVEAAATLLVAMEYEPGWIKTERFGATGG